MVLIRRAGSRKPLPEIVMMEQSPGIGDLHPREDIQRKSALFVSLEKIPIHLAEAVNEVYIFAGQMADPVLYGPGDAMDAAR